MDRNMQPEAVTMKFLKIIAPRFSLDHVAELTRRHIGLAGQSDLLYSERD
jgi:hypothetical protein